MEIYTHLDLGSKNSLWVQKNSSESGNDNQYQLKCSVGGVRNN